MDTAFRTHSPLNDDSDTKQRVIDAAVTCVKRWGIDKTSLNDIAREAGVSRPTVYSYFPSREEVIRAALIQSAYHFAGALLDHVDQFHNADERVLEAVLFGWKHLPEEPYLALVTDAELAQMVNEQALASPEGLEICHALFCQLLNNDERYLAEVAEIAEVSTRFLLSLLMMEGPVKRNEEEMRGFLQRRLLPALGFSGAH